MHQSKLFVKLYAAHGIYRHDSPYGAVPFININEQTGRRVSVMANRAVTRQLDTCVLWDWQDGRRSFGRARPGPAVNAPAPPSARFQTATGHVDGSAFHDTVIFSWWMMAAVPALWPCLRAQPTASSPELSSSTGTASPDVPVWVARVFPYITRPLLFAGRRAPAAAYLDGHSADRSQ